MAAKTSITPVPAKSFIAQLAVFFATGFGSGYSPIAPGTAGTLLAVVLYLLFTIIYPINFWVYILLLLTLTVLGCFAADRAGRHFGKTDAGQIVIDEIVGFLITMLIAPPHWLFILLGFILFRFFDIFKPWPARYFDERVSNGIGVIMDDVIAGIYGMVILGAIRIGMR